MKLIGKEAGSGRPSLIALRAADVPMNKKLPGSGGARTHEPNQTLVGRLRLRASGSRVWWEESLRYCRRIRDNTRMTSTGLKINNVEEILASIRSTLGNADRQVANWDVEEADPDEKAVAKFYVERAFIQLLTFLEAAGLVDTAKAVARIRARAKSNYAEWNVHAEVGAYLVWAEEITSYLSAIETTYVAQPAGRISKDLIEILRATQYSITDRFCFGNVPQSEDDVHRRIEAVLRCVFAKVRHKPPIAKPLKNFQPDTGLPSLKTLIEYKYIESDEDLKRVVDEVLADTRGYNDPNWQQFIYVIYETRRLKPEHEWREMLRENGVPENTDVIVISGEARDDKGKPAGKTIRQTKSVRSGAVGKRPSDAKAKHTQSSSS